MRNYILTLLLLLFLAACGPKALPPVVFDMPSRHVDYLTEVKPILDKRCVVCHSCYNSPCQLKLSSYEGVDRGGTKKMVYDSRRLTTMDPTRLFTDAQSTEEWRQKGFFSVTESSVEAGKNNSTMLQLLSHKMENPKSVGDYFSEERDLTCSATGIELGGYLEKHPNRGMPFGFPPLTKEEFNSIAGWLTQGAKGPTVSEQAALVSPSPADAKEIAKWEQFFNMPYAKYSMTARYLYEHLFLAQIRFTGKDYYELVRSTTPSGEPVGLINKVRPYDDPEAEIFYYRFRKIYSTIVHKTHMVFDLNDEVMNRFKELFIAPEWLQEPHVMGYGLKESANPFLTFEQIPPRSRYQFLLDNSNYIIKTFIRGPVCKGQIALNVINDHFWIMFLDPDHDLSVQYPALLKYQQGNLRMPIEKGSEFRVPNVVWNRYQDVQVSYYRYRQNFYMTHNYDGMGIDAIWPGNKAEDAPLLTVFRHFDSASVHRGAIGNLPRTMWVIDYPLFERIYYALVAGFDVFGNVGHQYMVRSYMDALRVEAESSFLEFMPLQKRRVLMQDWNQGIKLRDLYYYISQMPVKDAFSTDDPKREFVENVINHQLRPDCGIGFDPINYMAANEQYPELPKSYQSRDDVLHGFRAAARPGTDLVKSFNGYNANVAYLRIRVNPEDDKEDVVGSIIVNRWHDNVAVVFTEKKNLNPERDTVTFVEGFIGSYPNYFFDVTVEDLPEFLEMLSHFNGSGNGMEQMAKFGVNRGDDDFWQHYDWFQKRFFEEQPIQAGLFDLNRYYFRVY